MAVLILDKWWPLGRVLLNPFSLSSLFGLSWKYVDCIVKPLHSQISLTLYAEMCMDGAPFRQLLIK